MYQTFWLQLDYTIIFVQLNQNGFNRIEFCKAPDAIIERWGGAYGSLISTNPGNWGLLPLHRGDSFWQILTVRFFRTGFIIYWTSTTKTTGMSCCVYDQNELPNLHKGTIDAFTSCKSDQHKVTYNYYNYLPQFTGLHCNAEWQTIRFITVYHTKICHRRLFRFPFIACILFRQCFLKLSLTSIYPRTGFRITAFN